MQDSSPSTTATTATTSAFASFVMPRVLTFLQHTVPTPSASSEKIQIPSVLILSSLLLLLLAFLTMPPVRNILTTRIRTTSYYGRHVPTVLLRSIRPFFKPTLVTFLVLTRIGQFYYYPSSSSSGGERLDDDFGVVNGGIGSCVDGEDYSAKDDRSSSPTSSSSSSSDWKGMEVETTINLTSSTTRRMDVNTNEMGSMETAGATTAATTATTADVINSSIHTTKKCIPSKEEEEEKENQTMHRSRKGGNEMTTATSTFPKDGILTGILDTMLSLQHRLLHPRYNVHDDDDEEEESEPRTHRTRTETANKILLLLFLLLDDHLGLILLLYLLRQFLLLYNFSYGEWRESVVQSIFDFSSTYIPAVRREMRKEEDKMEVYLRESVFGGDDGDGDGDGEGRVVTSSLPAEGMDPIEVAKDLLQKAENENGKWQKGFVSGAVYSGETDHTALLNTVYAAYSLSNPLHPDIWPSVNRCEAEVISMTANLLNPANDDYDDDNAKGGSTIVGTTTSGGTESIVLAVRSHLKLYGKNRGITRPEIICGDTAHAGLDKACEMFQIRLIKVPCGEGTDFRLDPGEVERHMGSNVIMIYASAPCFPQGVIDPIEDLSDVALRYGVGLHVDACLGGFVLPFARMLGDGYEVPKFDFQCPGVTSMSADTHKYGYASKGTSVVLYRTKELRRAQYFNYSKWTGGLYVTPTIAGSRPGALLACAWASLVSIGESGFKSRVKIILDATRKIAKSVSQIEGLHLLGGPNPDAMIVCFASNDDRIDTYAIGDQMTHRGWSLNSLQNPACIHICVTLKTVEHADKFIDDLKCVTNTLMKQATLENTKTTGSAAIYGMAGSMPAGPVNELLKLYTDVSLTCYTSSQTTKDCKNVAMKGDL